MWRLLNNTTRQSLAHLYRKGHSGAKEQSGTLIKEHKNWRIQWFSTKLLSNIQYLGQLGEWSFHLSQVRSLTWGRQTGRLISSFLKDQQSMCQYPHRDPFQNDGRLFWVARRLCSSEQMWDGYNLSCVLPSFIEVSVTNAIVPCGVDQGSHSWGFPN